MQIIANGGLLPEDTNNVIQVGGLFRRKFQFHHLGRTMKKETVTGYFVIMTEYTVEIAVEQK
ncbi:hypothetical protein NE634_17745, partial [Lacrimispora saccharolytica]|nr:hypothetical protein [Lacrimispora saccharolytica]